ncbi:hypothetical protein [Streptosporangium roseum]|uniref:hypothetical protein n=1 Tax=Streptosporangium roseum TaxID=2001 RepID=UPI003329DC17
MDIESFTRDLAPLTPAERVRSLSHMYRAMRAVADQLGEELKEAAKACVDEDIDHAARLLDLPPDVIARLSSDPDTPDVALLRRGLKIVSKRPDLPFDGVCDAADALAIEEASDDAIREIARLLVLVSDIAPAEGAVWDAAPQAERSTFRQAVEYAKTLL